MDSAKDLAQRLISNPVRLAVCVLAYLLLVPFGYLFGGILHVSKPMRPLFAFSVCLAIVLLTNWFIPKFWAWIKSSIDVRWFFLHYAADRTVGVSQAEALMSAGKYAEAADEIDRLMAKHGLEPNICRVALNLHLGKFGSPERAETLLRSMRNEKPAEYERMATQRLVDLYMTRPESHNKALTELRRLAVKFPGTPEAAGALQGIELLKAQAPKASSLVY